MSNKKALNALAIAAGIVLIVIGIVYFVNTADSLPSFFPGHETGSTDHHIKHGLLAVALGIGCFVFAWFNSAPARDAA
jgi:hypothetical protein